ncbi:MAG: hypothetical protein WKG01_41035 [Kofleriaceae bacterium]
MRRALSWLVTAAIVPALWVRAGTASADPIASRAFTAPTAWLPPANVIVASAGLDMRELVGDSRVDDSLIVSVGLGGIAALELGTDSDIRACVDCTVRPVSTWLGRAGFRIGARQDAWFAGMPALVLGARTTYTSRSPFEDARLAEIYAVASRVLGPLRAHLGAAISDASHGGSTADGADDVEQGPRLRPLAGLEWTPSQYPKTSLVGDVAWIPRLEETRIEVEWVASWGVRYQAVAWASIELFVRHREEGALADSAVLMRVHGVLDPNSGGSKR